LTNKTRHAMVSKQLTERTEHAVKIHKNAVG
jgi:hypothetical protein